MQLPTVTTTRNKDRTIIAAWTLDENTDDPPATVEAQLSTHHDGNRKVFFSTLRVVTRKREGAFNVESSWLFDFVRVGAKACPRFSQKGLEAAHVFMLDELTAMAAQDHEGVVTTFASRFENMAEV